MIGNFIFKIFFKHIDLVVLFYTSFDYCNYIFCSLCKCRIFINFLSIFVRFSQFCRIYITGPTSFFMIHPFFSSFYSFCVDWMFGKFCNIIELNEIGVSFFVIFFSFLSFLITFIFFLCKITAVSNDSIWKITGSTKISSFSCISVIFGH